MLAKLSFAVLALLSHTSQAAVAEDLMTSIPGMGLFNTYKAYSGFLDGRQDDKGNVNVHLHYVFIESQDSPADDPVLIWFNGGPGCSSMLGFAGENGPYVNEDGTQGFTKNPWPWNKRANVLYLEMPGGVGYSYVDNPELLKTDDL